MTDPTGTTEAKAAAAWHWKNRAEALARIAARAAGKEGR